MKKKLLSLLLVAAMTVAALQVSVYAGAVNVYADDEDEDLAEINIALMCFAPMDQSITQPIEDAVNEIIEDEIEVHANISWYDAATYGTQIPMQIQAGEKLDLIMFTPVPGASYVSYRAANQLLDISEYLDEEGQDLVELEGDLLKGTSFGDAVYGVTNFIVLRGGQVVFVRKDLADEAGVTEDIQNAKTWTELGDACKKIVETSGMAAFVNTDAEGTVLYPRPFRAHGDNFEDAYWYDSLGDGYNMIMADPESDTVVNYYETDDYKEMAARSAQWYQDGLIYKDAMTTQDYSDTLVKSGSGFAEIRSAEIGSLEASQAATGYELIENTIVYSKIATSSTTKFGYAVPVTATEPEAAVRYLNYLFLSEDLNNILAWGVEGVNWERNEDGMATYPEGVTADTVGYHTGDFLYGNRDLTIPWEGDSPDVRDQQRESFENAEISKYMGFTVDNTGLENIVTACHDVCNQYHPILDSGSASDWEATYAEFIDKLKAAGIDQLIEAYQGQLDAWLAENA